MKITSEPLPFVVILYKRFYINFPFVFSFGREGSITPVRVSISKISV
jgi:hypothetical protein